MTVAIMLILFGIAFIVIENYHKGKKAKVTALDGIDYKTCFLDRYVPADRSNFSRHFRVREQPSSERCCSVYPERLRQNLPSSWPFRLCLAQDLLKLVKFGLAFTSTELAILLIGMVTAFVSSLIIIRFLLGYIKKHDFKVFGYYRIILGVLVLAYFFFS